MNSNKEVLKGYLVNINMKSLSSKYLTVVTDTISKIPIETELAKELIGPILSYIGILEYYVAVDDKEMLESIKDGSPAEELRADILEVIINNFYSVENIDDDGLLELMLSTMRDVDEVFEIVLNKIISLIGSKSIIKEFLLNNGLEVKKVFSIDVNYVSYYLEKEDGFTNYLINVFI